jgi:hypothetical protein
MGLFGGSLDVRVPAAQEQATRRAYARANETEIGRGVE